MSDHELIPERHWLLIDTPFLCRRAFHSLPTLKAKEIPTQVIYGVFRDIAQYMETYRTGDIVLCFDSGYNLRKELFPGYKAKRHAKELTEEEQKAHKELHRQIKQLRRDLLPLIGFKNVLCKKGYESDDIIASICKNLSGTDRATIISADGDLLQLLAWNVNMYNPAKRETMTVQSFAKKYGMDPHQWALVKEIGGCSTDEVPGCAPGIAEGRAIAYVAGKLKPGAHTKAIESPEAMERRKLNRRLTKLPFKGTPVYDLVPGCTLSEDGWWEACSTLGFSSMMKKGRYNPFRHHMMTISQARKEYKEEKAKRRTNHD